MSFEIVDIASLVAHRYSFTPHPRADSASATGSRARDEQDCLLLPNLHKVFRLQVSALVWAERLGSLKLSSAASALIVVFHLSSDSCQEGLTNLNFRKLPPHKTKFLRSIPSHTPITQLRTQYPEILPIYTHNHEFQHLDKCHDCMSHPFNVSAVSFPRASRSCSC